MANILHILNGDARRPAMEQSSVAGTLSAWPDVLHEGPTPLATGDVAPALRRLLEEFPASVNGLARSERQILEVLAEGPRTPEQAFVASARFEEAIYMGDVSFWDAVKRLSGGPHPLIALDVQAGCPRVPCG